MSDDKTILAILQNVGHIWSLAQLSDSLDIPLNQVESEVQDLVSKGLVVIEDGLIRIS